MSNSLILLVAHRALLQLLHFAPLLLDRSVLLSDLALLIGGSILLSLQLVADQTTAQGTHSPSYCRASAGMSHCATDDRAASRTYPSTHERALFSGTQRL